jgi:hypothetical protein
MSEILQNCGYTHYVVLDVNNGNYPTRLPRCSVPTNNFLTTLEILEERQEISF